MADMFDSKMVTMVTVVSVPVVTIWNRISLVGRLTLPTFVNPIDPMRAAAELIKSFALEKQVLVFTCHPSQAAIFGVPPIELERLN